MRTVIKNGIVLTMNENRDVFRHGYLVIEGSKIVEIGAMEDYKATGADIETDARGGIVMPGMINTHCHMGMIPFRGLGDDCKDRLRKFLLPMEAEAMDREMAVLSSRYAICELLLSGVTTVMDMYYFEESVAEAMDQMGIRGIAGETVMEDATCDAQSPEEAIQAGIRLMERYQNHPRIRGCIAPHGTTTCSGNTLQRIYDENRKRGAIFTLHTAEMDYEMALLKEIYGCSPVEYLNRLGVLGDHVLLAHCIQVSPEDLGIMAAKQCHVAHCIGSNTKAAKGVAPVSVMQEAGIFVGLGTDGPASGNTLDLFTQMRFFANFHKNETRDRSIFPSVEIVAKATIEGAAALGMEKVTGSLEVGKEADLVVVETDSVNMFPVYDPYAALVYSARAENVRDVYVAGECLVKDKRLTGCEFREVRGALYEKMRQTAFGRELQI